MLDVVRDVGVVDGDAVINIVFGVGDATISPAPDLSLTLLVLTFCFFRVRIITMKICLGAKNNTGRAGFTLTNKSLPATTLFYEMSHSVSNIWGLQYIGAPKFYFQYSGKE